MTPEQKAAIAAAKARKVEEGAEVEANVDEVAAEPIEGAEAAETDEIEHSQPDYEALFKAEKERADTAEAAAADIAFKARDAKRKGKNGEEAVEEDDGDDDKPMTRGEARAFLATQGQQIQKAAQENTALTIARANTSTEAEAQAAVLFYKTRVTPTGNLEDDVLFAIGGLNRKRTVAKAGELARALKSKETALHSSASVHRDTAPGSEPKLTPQDAYAIKQSGMVWDGKQRVYKKPLGNGAKHLYFDPKSKRRWTA